ncbi:pyruvate formate lyase activating enzyme [Hydrogenispora ethanolica]|uniref:Pyruvate formate lyase activating enzyme n=1 Tax=Hydrogenispora ethanolica TaxID=1082276 RepID=A0A4V2QBG7_HYDET|nr:AmmeMemoRadiSam system radical SAM enzyme [Hydrogenispora ethanolica]TCL56042.1 pyruvate formate lyase activating enzyme [Hydrogenispora ethanolica]
MIEARYYEILPEGQLICRLCPQQCRIAPEKSGFCRVRSHREGRLTAENFGRIASIALDPIEKKPLYHYYPCHSILSVGTIGCNLACRFCQNWQISREKAPTQSLDPAQLAGLAVRASREHGSIGLAYTYSEPGVWFEFLMATMPLLRERGLKNVLVTNGFLQPEPWADLLEWTDAANIDLKGFDAGYYRRLCSGSLEPVLANIRAAAGRIHLELTTLIIPGENDRPEEIRALAQWIADLDPEIPLHLSRYFPNYQLTAPPTPLETMEEAHRIAREYLRFVYLGNTGGGNDTRCPECGAVWVERNGYRTKLLSGADCPGCGRKVSLVLEDEEGGG